MAPVDRIDININMPRLAYGEIAGEAVADLAGEEVITAQAVAEAVHLRNSVKESVF